MAIQVRHSRNKKVLSLSPFFYPEMISTGRFNTILCNTLYELGYDVTAVSSYPLYPSWKPVTTTQGIDGIDIVRGGANVRYPRNVILRRAILELWFSYFAVVNVIRLRKDIDHVISHLPPSLFSVLISYLLPKGVRHTVLVADLQYVYLEKKKGLLAGVIKKFVALLEKQAFKKADCVVFMSRSMRDYVTNNFNLSLDNAKVLYPSVTLKKGAECHQKLGSYFDPGRYHVVYSGALGEKQIPMIMLQCFEKIAEKLDYVNFHIFSDGEFFEQLKTHADVRFKKRIGFYPLVDEACLEELYAYSDLQVVPQMTGTSDGSMPSKVPNLMMMYTRIFAITDRGSELASILEQYPLSSYVSSNDITDIVTGMVEYIEKSRNAGEMSKPEKDEINNFIDANFNLKKFAENLLTDGI